ncbi:MAG: 3-deoxy-D-manno-octulosonic acid transferase [Rhodobacteraceae bacterium]|nr:3-deoxy-D-manno-octulosonic acid transferase [Paracoccaceae bacterium]
MIRPPGLLAYLSLRSLGSVGARRRIAGEIAHGGAEAARLPERMGQPTLRRPEGPLVWLHASGPAQEGALTEMARRIGEAHEEASVLVTTDAPPTREPGPGGRWLHQFVPDDAARPVAAFLDHWRPDIGIWAGTALRPALIDEAARRGVPLCLIDAAAAPAPDRGWRRLARLNATALRRFGHVLATDDRAAAELVEAGAAEGAVEVAGPLEEEAPIPPCNLQERDALAAILKGRPVWLAVGVPETEEGTVITAHRNAARLAHRLMLILVPADPARGATLAAALANFGFAVALRSADGEPDAATEILVADGEGDLGLWYRLAPVTYMGGTLVPGPEGGTRSPLEPAALGSAILHGPATGAHAALYARFAEAGGARVVAGPGTLGEALSELLSPDRAAALAHAAWRVSTGGADMNERVLALVAGALRRARGAAP